MDPASHAAPSGPCSAEACAPPTDEAEPEALFTCGRHARKHLSVEVCLYLLDELTSAHGSDSRVTAVVGAREIYLVFNMNPDGSEYDSATAPTGPSGSRADAAPGRSAVGPWPHG